MNSPTNRRQFFGHLGSGLGGVTAALVAHDLGYSTAVLEKDPKLGGVCSYSGGETFNPNNREMRAAGFEDSEEAAREYFDFVAAGFNEPELTDRLLACRHEALEYLTDHAGMGIGIRIIIGSGVGAGIGIGIGICIDLSVNIGVASASASASASALSSAAAPNLDSPRLCWPRLARLASRIWACDIFEIARQSRSPEWACNSNKPTS